MATNDTPDGIDVVTVYASTEDGQWRWRRQAAGNRAKIAHNGEGHPEGMDHTIDMARRINRPPFLLVVLDHEGEALQREVVTD